MPSTELLQSNNKGENIIVERAVLARISISPFHFPASFANLAFGEAMKIRVVYILIATALGAGMAYRHRRNVARQNPPEVAPVQAAQPAEPNEPGRDIRQMIPRASESSPKPGLVMAPAPSPPTETQSRTASANNRAMQYWEKVAQRFARQQEQLNNETDQAKRMNLIRIMARNVRMDTPSTLDWAMGLEDPEERRAAFEAINDNALTGIGARIEMDETGLPKIRETTILSAVASTGQVEPGDYISGMVNSDGSIVYFKDRPIRQIVQYLRGQAGSEIQLLMERMPADGSAEPYSFDVAVQRSMLVVHPPF